MTHLEARASNAVVEDMISILGHAAYAFFYPGAIHTFISNVFACKLNRLPESLGFQQVYLLRWVQKG